MIEDAVLAAELFLTVEDVLPVVDVTEATVVALEDAVGLLVVVFVFFFVAVVLETTAEA